MDKIYKILGKRGRITIPWEIRQDVGFSYNDILSFSASGNTIVVTKEKLCNNCIETRTEAVKQAKGIKMPDNPEREICNW